MKLMENVDSNGAVMSDKNTPMIRSVANGLPCKTLLLWKLLAMQTVKRKLKHSPQDVVKGPCEVLSDHIQIQLTRARFAMSEDENSVAVTRIKHLHPFLIPPLTPPTHTCLRSTPCLFNR